MLLGSLLDPHADSLLAIVKDPGHVGADENLATGGLDHRDEVVGDLGGSANRIISAGFEKVTMDLKLTQLMERLILKDDSHDLRLMHSAAAEGSIATADIGNFLFYSHTYLPNACVNQP